jgi:pilus assembly protein CpaC
MIIETNVRKRRWRFCLLAPAGFTAVCGFPPTALAQTQCNVSHACWTGVAAPVSNPGPQNKSEHWTAVVAVPVEASAQTEIIHLPVGRSLVLTTHSALRRVYVSDPKVLQPFSSTPWEEVITAKTSGVSTLMLWDSAGRRRVYTVFADVDTEGMLNVLEDAVPGARLSVSTRGGRVWLAGTVPSDVAAEAVMKLTSVYSKDVVNAVKVLPPPLQEVELKLRIIEVDRSRLEQFGVNFFALGSTLASTSTQQFASSVIPASSSSGTGLTVSDPLNLLLYSAKLNVGVTVKDLEQKEVLQVLAEPTLTTLSGVPARFLSGGEFPLPIVQGGTGNSTAITIVFKPYGVKVDFTPTVNPDGSIRLKVAPEVSALDYGNAVTIAGFTIPALSTRRAETEVELVNGQSFVLSGLLDRRTTANLSKTPGIASVPILGQLFRSKDMNHSVVELVVLVTATIVDPTGHPQAPVLPRMVIPNMDRDHFDNQFPVHSPATATPASPTKDQP